jgi:SAM-dependent methyltransferase
MASVLGLERDQSATAGSQKGADYYDELYSSTDVYRCSYPQSYYYFLWSIIADRARRDQVQRVFEIGCGPGQLAAYLLDQGVRHYTGFDLSPVAVEFARQRVPAGNFFVGSALDPAAYAGQDFGLLVCTEVLEHIDDDLRVLSLVAPGRRCICTVPNFAHESHVRFFQNAEEVRGRYGPLLDNLDVMTLRSPRAAADRFFLFDGIRNSCKLESTGSSPGAPR